MVQYSLWETTVILALPKDEAISVLRRMCFGRMLMFCGGTIMTLVALAIMFGIITLVAFSGELIYVWLIVGAISFCLVVAMMPIGFLGIWGRYRFYTNIVKTRAKVADRMQRQASQHAAAALAQMNQMNQMNPMMQKMDPMQQMNTAQPAYHAPQTV